MDRRVVPRRIYFGGEKGTGVVSGPHFCITLYWELIMQRQKRVDEAGVLYHAINRGNARQAILLKHEDYEAFLGVLSPKKAPDPFFLLIGATGNCGPFPFENYGSERY
jgi:hypothetical protein